ncbi:MAG TPA: hypothetical protein ENK66_03815 [Arcobacter sp.]|nr:hypothetical protein [Arcobacter sp.]
MKKVVINVVFLMGLVYAEPRVIYENIYANQDRKNPDDATRSGFNSSIDVGYTTYLIDVSSIELNRAIDYNVVEATLGVSYAYGDWIFGIDTKILMDEQKSNLNASSRILNSNANISRNTFSLFSNYQISKELSMNMVYRYASLQSNNRYIDFKTYDTAFNYDTNGLASSIVYTPSFFEGLFLSTGAVYSRANVEIYEKINTISDDVFIDDSASSLGVKLGIGYAYTVNDNLFLKLSSDWYKFDFGKLNVSSSSSNKIIEQASLGEETYSIRFGVLYQF